ncbi:MAG: chemotaxis protein CheW [Gammaproteobacteria bacterium]
MKKQGIKTATKPPVGLGSKQDESTQPEQWQCILKARAQALALAPEQVATTECIEIVTFLLAYETYGIETAWVREVYPLKDLTPLPCTPPFVAGIVNVRGQVVSVIDIKKFFDLPEKGLTELNKAIILSDGVMEFGILADVILEVRSIPLQQIQPSLPALTGIPEQYLLGISSESITVLDANSLLTSCSIVVHEEVV